MPIEIIVEKVSLVVEASIRFSATGARITTQIARAEVIEKVVQDCVFLCDRLDLNRWPLFSTPSPLFGSWIFDDFVFSDFGNGSEFWADWYDKALNGEPQDWELLTKVALIPSEDWDKGAEHVNALIAQIQLEHIAETRPLGEDAIDKGADGLWHRVGRSNLDRDILQDARDSVADAVERARAMIAGNNALAALRPELDLLDRALSRYPDRPLRLHDTFTMVQGHIARDLNSGELSDEHIVRDLSQTLGTAALDMRNGCEKTRQVVEERVEARFAEIGPDARVTLVQITQVATRMSDADLAQEFTYDAEVIEGKAEPVEDRKTLLYRLTTRLAKIATVDSKNVVDALKEIGAVGGGITTLGMLIWFLLSLIL